MNRKWAMLICLLLVQPFVAFVGRSIGPLAPFLEKDFQISKAEIGLLTAALFFGQSLVNIPAIPPPPITILTYFDASCIFRYLANFVKEEL